MQNLENYKQINAFLSNIHGDFRTVLTTRQIACLYMMIGMYQKGVLIVDETARKDYLLGLDKVFDTHLSSL